MNVSLYIKQLELFCRKLFNSQYSGGTPEVLVKPRNVFDAIANPLRIVVLRQDRIGDVLVSTPLLQALRTSFPDATITMVLSTNNVAVREAVEPYVNDILVYKKGLLGFLSLRRQLIACKAHAVIDCMDNPSSTSALLMVASKAKIRLGIDKSNRGAYTHVVPMLDRASVNIVDRLLNISLAFGQNPVHTTYSVRYPLNSSDLQNIANCIPKTKTRCIWSISGSDRFRMYPVEQVKAAISALAEEFPAIQWCVCSAPHHAHLLEGFSAVSNVVVIPPAERFPLFAAWISSADLLITPDTSTVHLAAAFTIPCVVFYYVFDSQLLPWYPYQTPVYPLIAKHQEVSSIPLDTVVETIRMAISLL
jgi:ADP-heptose:LPS heptosyltransferase